MQAGGKIIMDIRVYSADFKIECYYEFCGPIVIDHGRTVTGLFLLLFVVL